MPLTDNRLGDLSDNTARKILGCLMAFQTLAFIAYVDREVAWDSVIKGDPAWYTYYCYKMFYALVHNDLASVVDLIRTSPWGCVLFFQSAALQLLFGSSRLTVVSINLIYYLLCQAGTYWFFRRLTQSATIGVTMVALLMAAHTPFRAEGPALNIRDFHFDLILFFLLLLSLYLVAWTNTLARRKPTIWLAIFMAYVVATRLVSIFVFAAGFGMIAIVLGATAVFGSRDAASAARRRLMNGAIGGAVFVGLSAIPIGVAGLALYNHYFRFIFEPEFAEQRKGLYVMGSPDKWDQAVALLQKTYGSDLGAVYWATFALVVVFAAALVWRGADSRKAIGEDAAVRPWQLSDLLLNRGDYRLFCVFLALFGVGNYVQHLAFVIKSDHLTRATTAPLMVLMWVAAARLMMRPTRPRWARLGLSPLAAVALFGALVTQVSFYASPGRGSADKAEVLKINDLYRDMAEFTRRAGLKDPAISVDFGDDKYAVGALMPWHSYMWEKYGLFTVPNGQLGHHPDEVFPWPTPLTRLQASDIVLSAGVGHLPTGWPLDRSLSPHREAIAEYMSRNMSHCGTYVLFGERRDLYVRPRFPWRISASASTEARFGPQDLLGPRTTIWHAPWSGSPQWVLFESETPIKPEELAITAQDGGFDRAPRDFELQATDDVRSWQSVLTVKGESWRVQERVWPLNLARPYCCYRLLVTANNGAPTLMTIQKVKLQFDGDRQPPPCPR